MINESFALLFCGIFSVQARGLPNEKFKFLHLNHIVYIGYIVFDSVYEMSVALFFVFGVGEFCEDK